MEIACGGLWFCHEADGHLHSECTVVVKQGGRNGRITRLPHQISGHCFWNANLCTINWQFNLDLRILTARAHLHIATMQSNYCVVWCFLFVLLFLHRAETKSDVEIFFGGLRLCSGFEESSRGKKKKSNTRSFHREPVVFYIWENEQSAGSSSQQQWTIKFFFRFFSSSFLSRMP